MGNCKISSDLKECALKLWNVGWDIKDICDALGVSRASVYCWKAIFTEYDTVKHPPSPIRGQQLCILTRALMTACEDLFAEESDLYLDEVVMWLTLTHDISISVSTLCRNLKEAGLTQKLLHKLAVERDEQHHNEWREAMMGQQAPLTDVFVHGDHYSLVAAITTKSYVAAHVVEGSFNGETFLAFVAVKLLPYMNPFPGERSVLMLNNCRIHHNEELQELVWNTGK
ncbi:uncharacterized protein EDB91DRAFT_1058956 [Suillus paluster]|uniref:uncharacterized protein n=1 Tax=Suillus paluster TaxID=48578 RepID=UPI001B872C41|nr:uncharacterized protein EDB91DRAFT_1058956 [Suillus paluster]KAG1731086.1 hypothetical protein EDB91DRAFT_1058956 [Suillus paluster]